MAETTLPPEQIDIAELASLAGEVADEEVRKAERRESLTALLRRFPESVQRSIAEEGKRRGFRRFVAGEYDPAAKESA